MKKKILRGVGITALIVILVLSASGYYLLRGMREMQNLVIQNVDLHQIEDGTYTGIFAGENRWANRVSVMVSGQRIVGVEILAEQQFHRDEVTEELFQRVIDAQRVDVDAVSGATLSSKGYLKALENALKYAVK